MGLLSFDLKEHTCPICERIDYGLHFHKCIKCKKMICSGCLNEKRICRNCDVDYQERQKQGQKEWEKYSKSVEKGLKNLLKVKMYSFGSPMSRKLSNTPGIEKKEVGTISLPNFSDVENYKAILANMTLEMGGDTLINLDEHFFKDREGDKVTVKAVVLNLDWEKKEKNQKRMPKVPETKRRKKTGV